MHELEWSDVYGFGPAPMTMVWEVDRLLSFIAGYGHHLKMLWDYDDERIVILSRRAER